MILIRFILIGLIVYLIVRSFIKFGDEESDLLQTRAVRIKMASL